MNKFEEKGLASSESKEELQRAIDEKLDQLSELLARQKDNPEDLEITAQIEKIKGELDALREKNLEWKDVPIEDRWPIEQTLKKIWDSYASADHKITHRSADQPAKLSEIVIDLKQNWSEAKKIVESLKESIMRHPEGAHELQVQLIKKLEEFETITNSFQLQGKNEAESLEQMRYLLDRMKEFKISVIALRAQFND